jgi:hypothetical protein
MKKFVQAIDSALGAAVSALLGPLCGDTFFTLVDVACARYLCAGIEFALNGLTSNGGPP